MPREFIVTLSSDGYWDNTYKKAVVADNIKMAVKKANKSNDYLMEVKEFIGAPITDGGENAENN